MKFNDDIAFTSEGPRQFPESAPKIDELVYLWPHKGKRKNI